MPDNISTVLTGDIHSGAVDLLRVEAAEQQRILRMLYDLEADITDKIRRNVGKSAITNQRLEALLAQTRDTIKSSYSEMTESNIKALGDVSTATAYQIGDAINKAIGVDVASTAFTKGQLTSLANQNYFMGRHLEEYWSTSGEQLFNRFTSEMRMGMLQGEGVPELSRRLTGTSANNYSDGVMNMPRYQADAIVRTGVVGAANAGRLETYHQNADLINGIQWVATLDDRVCPICQAMDGLQWELPESGDPEDYGGYIPVDHDKPFEGPTAHISCRCAQIPVVKSYEELKGDEVMTEEQLNELDPEFLDGGGSTIGFEDWIKQQSVATQNEILGEQQAGLFRMDVLKVKDLVNQQHQPLTPAELLKKYGAPPKMKPKTRIELRGEAMAKRMLYDPAKIEYVGGKPPTFKLAGNTYKYGGWFDPKTGTVRLFTDNLMSEQGWDSLIAHEIGHAQYNLVITKELERERSLIMQMSKTESEKFFKPNGTVRPEAMTEFQDQFPVSSMIGKTWKYGYEAAMSQTETMMLNEMKAADGISSYSRQYWTPAGMKDWGFGSAVNETLAEIQAWIESKAASPMGIPASHLATPTAQWLQFAVDIRALYKRFMLVGI